MLDQYQHQHLLMLCAQCVVYIWGFICEWIYVCTARFFVLRVNVYALHYCVPSPQRNEHRSAAINSLEVWEEDHILPRGDVGMKTMVKRDLCSIQNKWGKQS